MSGILRRGSLNFIPGLNNSCSGRRRQDSGVYGRYRDLALRTPEISVIALDFQHYSMDLKKNGDNLGIGESAVAVSVLKETTNDLSQDVDSDIISNFIGHYRLWQFVWTLILTIFQTPPTMQMFTFVFQTADKDFWCSTTDSRNGTKNSCTVPGNNGTDHMKCTEFRFFDDGSGSMTLVEEYGLICDRKYFLTVVEMCFLAGAAVGSVCSGWISDRYGRKNTLMIFATVQVTFGIILAFSSSLAMYMTLRVIIGFASMTVAVVSFVLVVELVSGKWRTIIGILNILPMAVTYVLTAGIAYFIRDWRTLQLAVSLPWLALLFIWYCVPESPRWLLSCGRLDELHAILERAARFNGQQLPANYRKTLEAVAAPSEKAEEQNDTPTLSPDKANKSNTVEKTTTKTKTNPLIVAFNKTYLRTTCLNLIVWLTLVVLYYGLTLHLSNLGGDIYLNTAVVGSIEVVSILVSILIVLKIGIRRSLITFMLIAGIGCLLTNLVPEGDNNLAGVIALAMISKCVIGANNAIIPTYTAGQYPTEIRNFGVGLGNLAAGIALVLVPYVWLLEHITALLPLTVMGICGLIGAAGLCLMKDIQE